MYAQFHCSFVLLINPKFHLKVQHLFNRLKISNDLFLVIVFKPEICGEKAMLMMQAETGVKQL